MGRFTPGRSGNPAGRPPGRPDKRHALRELIQPHVPELVDRALALARSGDATAIRLLLDRVAPAMKPACEPVTFPLDTTKPLHEQGAAVLAAVSRGELAPDVGRALLDGLAAQGKLVELHDLVRRIDDLEQRGQGNDD